jgi:hypothetical protein
LLPFEDRYSRQRRLAEVGPDGQLRLERASLMLPPHPDSELEREYLLRAGVGQVEVDATALGPEFPWPGQFQFEGPLGVARAAWCALARLRAALGMPPSAERVGGGR